MSVPEISICNNLNELVSKKDHLVVLFGPPGSGKNYTGEKLESEYGYHFHDGDLDFTESQREHLRSKKLFTMEMHQAFFDNLCKATQSLLEIHSRVAVGTPLKMDRFRVSMLERFPEARLVLVDALREVRVDRIMSRTHPVPIEVLIKSGDEFEPITIPYTRLINNG